MTTPSTQNALNYFNQGMYGDLDWSATLDFMNRRYVQPLKQHLNIQNMTLADCAAGFGWLSFAWLQGGGGHAVLIEPDAPRLKAAQAIATQLGLQDRCTFINAVLQDCDLSVHRIDVFASIETLEHVGRPNIASCIQTMMATKPQALLITTPNFHFPVVAHDTRLPFCHWLPQQWRVPYAAAFNKTQQNEANDFVKASDLAPLTTHYKPVTRFQTFNTFAEFLAFYPHYLPYGAAAHRMRQAPSKALKCFVWLAGTLLGTRAWRCSPNLGAIWVKRS
jgi:cyclopropane fatty-acyl-phospholipid synthase-like methyltransferase